MYNLGQSLVGLLKPLQNHKHILSLWEHQTSKRKVKLYIVYASIVYSDKVMFYQTLPNLGQKSFRNIASSWKISIPPFPPVKNGEEA